MDPYICQLEVELFFLIAWVECIKASDASFERVGTAAGAGGSVVIQDIQESTKYCKYKDREVAQQNGKNNPICSTLLII